MRSIRNLGAYFTMYAALGLATVAYGQTTATIRGEGWACLEKDAMKPLDDARKIGEEAANSGKPPIMKAFASGLFNNFREKEWCRAIPLGTEVKVIEEDGSLARVKEIYVDRQPMWTSIDFLKR